MKILFVDVDGTLIEPASGKQFKEHPGDIKLMDGVVEAIARYKAQGYVIAGISNQQGVQYGYITLQDAVDTMRNVLSLLEDIECIMFCPDKGESCYRVTHQEWANVEAELWLSPFILDSYRKPGIGMIQYFISHYAYKHYVYPVDPEGEVKIEDELMVGDRPEDAQCAQNAGIRFIDAHVWRQGA